MDTTPFHINFHYGNSWLDAEIKPCCNKDNVVDYAVWIDDKLLFTIARHAKDNERWLIALKNADDEFDNALIQGIGRAIDEKAR
jgi:hypothetical protein